MLTGIGRIALVGFLLSLASSLATAAPPTPLVVWPGYALDLPSGYCVELRRGPDFAVRYVRSAPNSPVLAGIYAGHAPNFEPDCAKATKRSWTSNGLSIKSVRHGGECAEFLVSDPKKQERGFLHIWFGPDAKDHSQLAQRLVDSIRPAPSGSDSPEPPPCN